MADFISTESTLAAAEQAAAHGRYGDAEQHYRQLLTQTHVVDYEYEEWLRRLAELYQRLGRRREAGVCFLYLHYFDLAREVMPQEARLERARGHALEKRWLDAAREFLDAARPAQAAVAYEEAKDYPRAREIWAQLVRDARLRDRPYEKALVHFNLGLASHRAAGQSVVPAPGAEPAPDAHRHLVESQRILEQVADDFETRGERERAFDCYQILLKLGRDSGAFENLSEGYLNCIRVLKEDGLKFYVLQYYEDFVKLALERDELHAAATLYREAADYALRAGLPYHRHYLKRAAEVWGRAAEKGVATGSPLDLVENAFLASVECSSAVGDFARVRESSRSTSGSRTPTPTSGSWTSSSGRWTAIPSRWRARSSATCATPTASGGARSTSSCSTPTRAPRARTRRRRRWRAWRSRSASCSRTRRCARSRSSTSTRRRGCARRPCGRSGTCTSSGRSASSAAASSTPTRACARRPPRR
jgi:hypothetical protein